MAPASGVTVDGSAGDLKGEEVDSATGFRSVAGGFLVQFVIFGSLAAFPAFIGALEKDSSLGRPTRTQLSLVNSIASGPGPLIAGVLGGYVLDKFGARPVLALNAALYLFSLLMASFFAHSYQQLIGLYSLATTVAIGLSNGPVTAVISSWFDRRLSLAMGIAVAGGGVGSAILPAISGALLTAFHDDWRKAWQVLALFDLLLILSVFLLRKRRTPATNNHTTRPTKTLRETLLDMKTAIGYCCTLQFVTVFAVAVLFGIAYTAVLFLVMPFALDLGKEATPYANDGKISVATASWLYTGFGLSQTVGSFVLGPLGDKVGPHHVLGLSMAMGSIGCGWLGAGHNFVSLFLAFAVAGFAFAGCWAMIPSCLTRAFAGPHLGVVMGFGYMGIGVGALIGPPTSSMIADYPLSYQGSFIYLAAVCQVGAMIALVIPQSAVSDPSNGEPPASGPLLGTQN